MIKISDPGIMTPYTVTDFERAVADYVGYPYAVATNTGTAALHLALTDMEADGIVVIPPLCFRAVWNAVMQSGNKPAYGMAKHNIDVMNYGFPSAQNHGQILDASEAFGGEIPTNYRYVTFSFNWNKPVTCGSGGMILCQFVEDADDIRWYANQCKVDSIHFIHTDVTGYNYRMNDLQATLGIKSLAALPGNTAKRKAIHLRYVKSGLPVIKPPKDFKWNYWITLLRTPKRDKVLRAFQENDIEARAMFTPHTREFPEVNKYAAETMCLPSSPSLTEEEQEKVIKIVKENL